MKERCVGGEPTRAREMGSIATYSLPLQCLFFLEELGRFLTDDHTGRHCIAGGDARHDRAVGYAQIVDAVNLEPAVDHRHFIAAHLCGAVRMQISCRRISHEAFERAPPDCPA